MIFNRVCFFCQLASLLYVVSAFLFFLYPIDTQTLTSRAHATVQSGLNFAAVLLFALDSLMYNSGFALRRARDRKKTDDQEPLFRSFEFFAELFNTVVREGIARNLKSFAQKVSKKAVVGIFCDWHDSVLQSADYGREQRP